MNSGPKDVLSINKLSKASYRKMAENLIRAVDYNVIAIPLAAGVLANQGFLVTPAMAAHLLDGEPFLLVHAFFFIS